MASTTTFLDLTNRTLRRINEVELTRSNFASAVGIHAYVKDCVNNAVRDIVVNYSQWPFLWRSATQVLTPGVQSYPLPSNVSVDWDSFSVERDDALSPPVSESPLTPVDYDFWLQRLRSNDMQRDASTGSIPIAVTRPQDENEFIVSPVPDRAYAVRFEYWANPAELVDAADVCVVPDEYVHIIIEGAAAEVYLFRENIESHGISSKRYDEKLKDMARSEIRVPDRIRDTRIVQPGYWRR
jgi:hypothetical protein